MTQNTSIAALIMAAGASQRFNGDRPKSYMPACGKNLLQWSLDIFSNIDAIGRIMVVIRPEDQDRFQACDQNSKIQFCFGGASRQESVRLGLESLSQEPPDFVLIHDAARPNVAPADIEQMIEELLGNPEFGVALGQPLRDSLHRVDDNQCSQSPIDRESAWIAQTPQAYAFLNILTAHRNYQDKNFTDDLAVAQANGIRTRLIKSRSDNFKITTQEDLKKLESIHPLMPRVGFGYDIHRLGNGTSIILGGIRIPHHQSLIGHSDADVVLHALTDALLGTCGAGDIGVHFPPSEAKWKNASSDVFVKKACAIIKQYHGKIGNVDITLLAEEPKITPYRESMQDHIAHLLEIDRLCVNIKATTSEGIGAIGRNEGIAAHAVATVYYREIVL